MGRVTSAGSGRRGRRLLVVGVLALVGLVVGCGGDEPGGSSGPGSGRTLSVPADHPTIQDAVDAAEPGDLVLVSPGTYREAVEVDVPDLVIRGSSRAGVVLDGAGELDHGVKVTADRVAVENLTVRDYVLNGVLFTGSAVDPDQAAEDGYSGSFDPLVGYRASYVTATGNGLYGVYAFAAVQGLIEQVYVSGSPDSGIYVGQCAPCDVVIRDSTAEYNAVGFLATNASQDVFLVHSTFRRNRVGVAINSQDVEELAPQAGAVVAGNVVVDNAEIDAPVPGTGGFGVGIVVGGGTEDVVDRNRVEGHPVAGILVTDLDGYRPRDNRVVANVLARNEVDLAYGWQGAPTEAAGNCFAGNEFAVSGPPDIESVLPCAGPATVGPDTVELPPGPAAGSGGVPDPPADLPDMPDAPTAPAVPAGPPPVVDLDAITVPEPG